MLQALARALPVKRDKIKFCWIWISRVALASCRQAEQDYRVVCTYMPQTVPQMCPISLQPEFFVQNLHIFC